MTIKGQIDHAIEYRYPVQITQRGEEKPDTGTIKWCVADIDCIVLWNGISDCHIDYDQIDDVQIPYKKEKLTLFYVNSEYLDKYATRYDEIPNHKHNDSRPACCLCNSRHPIAIYRQSLFQSNREYCIRCVNVVNWEDLMENYGEQL